MSGILEKTGIQPVLRDELKQRDKALSGDIVMAIIPTAVTSVPTDQAWVRYVTIKITSADGKVHDWLTQDYATKLSIANTSVAGTATIASTTLKIVRGQAVVEVEGDAEDWLNAETNTLTVGNLTILGYTVTGGTSVETFTTPA
jgi:hypothetical protein